MQVCDLCHNLQRLWTGWFNQDFVLPAKFAKVDSHTSYLCEFVIFYFTKHWWVGSNLMIRSICKRKAKYLMVEAQVINNRHGMIWEFLNSHFLLGLTRCCRRYPTWISFIKISMGHQPWIHKNPLFHQQS